MSCRSIAKSVPTLENTTHTSVFRLWFESVISHWVFERFFKECALSHTNTVCNNSLLFLHYYSKTRGHTMVQAVSGWPITVEAHVRTRVAPSGICGGQSGAGTGFFRVLRFSPVCIISLRSTLIYDGLIRCAIALTKQHIIISMNLS
jgi:hypothetical protein